MTLRDLGYRRFWKWAHYGWGWDFGPVFGWWLVWSRSGGGPLHVYVSNDATPPDTPRTRGFFLYRARRA